MKKYRVKINDKEFIVEIEPIVEKKQKVRPTANIDINEVSEPKASGAASKQNNDPKKVFANLPGNILKILKNKGDSVNANDGVLILEAMKMENEIVALIDGKIKNIYVEVGQKVNKDDLLFELE
ncbi:MAG TPA: biotin/lipoyl-binding protein [bacterium]|nr:biotin/lipoyl-binding protein [bacterium]